MPQNTSAKLRFKLSKKTYSDANAAIEGVDGDAKSENLDNLDFVQLMHQASEHRMQSNDLKKMLRKAWRQGACSN